MRHLHRRQFIAGRRHHRRRVLPPRQDGGHRETRNSLELVSDVEANYLSARFRRRSQEMGKPDQPLR